MSQNTNSNSIQGMTLLIIFLTIWFHYSCRKDGFTISHFIIIIVIIISIYDKLKHLIHQKSNKEIKKEKQNKKDNALNKLIHSCKINFEEYEKEIYEVNNKIDLSYSPKIKSYIPIFTTQPENDLINFKTNESNHKNDIENEILPNNVIDSNANKKI